MHDMDKILRSSKFEKKECVIFIILFYFSLLVHTSTAYGLEDFSYHAIVFYLGIYAYDLAT
jgi:hypothetical protein